MRYVVAGGGTGGHLFPGIALADAFRDLDPDAEIVFMGASGGLEARIVPDLGYKLVTLPVRGVVNMGIMRGFTRGMNMLWSIYRAYGILGKLSPDLVVGVGGYASVPAVVAAARRKTPRCILEQNVVPGKASRFLARYAEKIYLGFPTLKPVFPPGKTVITGNPIRTESLPPKQKKEFAGEQKTLLILGGSQGAAQLNDIAMLIVPSLMARNSSLKVVQQTGPDHENAVREHYTANKIDVEVVPFIKHMGEYYSRADLCLSRAGAMAVSELAAAGVPSILIPYPHAVSDHQRANGRWLEEWGGAVTLEPERAKPEILIEMIEHLVNSPKILKDMSDICLTAGTSDAAQRIAREEIGRLEALREGASA
ncbi:undecaprenyldiphospho-muramoylpentapeptide beta-N-acetylglucosaminyltransferase [bacterium]|nr:MAG: undecaprenyldiphospho-muramoylpentapeptide beta-N-acetylglucosaminyltransferase [bacterium]